jgi:hypothetical protein
MMMINPTNRRIFEYPSFAGPTGVNAGTIVIVPPAGNSAGD